MSNLGGNSNGWIGGQFDDDFDLEDEEEITDDEEEEEEIDPDDEW